MYSRLRTSLKQKSKQRGTYKRSQQGGAAWKQLSPANLPIWTEVLAGTPFTFLLTPSTGVNEYITIVERQDELFGLAVQAIFKKLGTPADADESAISAQIATKSKEARQVIADILNDVGDLILFNRFARTGQKATKLQKIIDQPPIELLVNPKQVENRFVNDLAAICIVMKKDKTVIDSFKANEDIKQTRALRYEAITESNSYQMTSNKLRDGFYPFQTTVDFRTTMGHDKGKIQDGFWYNFLGRCVPDQPNTYSEADPQKSAYFAACVFRAYNGDSSATFKENVIKQMLGGIPQTRKSDRSAVPDLEHRPDDDYLQYVVVPDITLGQILNQVSIGFLQFILHLCYTIQKNEAEVLTEAGFEPESPSTENPLLSIISAPLPTPERVPGAPTEASSSEQQFVG